MKISAQDLAAVVVAITLSVGVVILSIQAKPVGDALSSGFGVAVGWVFFRSTQVASNGNGGPK